MFFKLWDMALIENNASVAAEIAVNLAKKYLQNSFNNNTSECIFVSKRNPVSKKEIFIYSKMYITLSILFPLCNLFML